MQIDYLNLYSANANTKQAIDRLMLWGINYFKRFLKKNYNRAAPISNTAACGPVPAASIPPSHSSLDIDLMIYVIGGLTTDTMIGKPCVMDSKGPSFAYIYLNEGFFANTNLTTLFNDFTFELRYYDILKEFMHILAMNTNLYNFFPGGSLNAISKTRTFLGKTVRYVDTPKLKARIQDHYGCYQSNIGAVLYSDNELFEKTLLFDDLMTKMGSVGHKLVFSEFNMAFLQDSGNN
jgi:hypothetical protein